MKSPVSFNFELIVNGEVFILSTPVKDVSKYEDVSEKEIKQEEHRVKET